MVCARDAKLVALPTKGATLARKIPASLDLLQGRHVFRTVDSSDGLRTDPFAFLPDSENPRDPRTLSQDKLPSPKQGQFTVNVFKSALDGIQLSHGARNIPTRDPGFYCSFGTTSRGSRLA